MFHLYILYSDKLEKFYIGFTGERVEMRLHNHLSNHKGYTSRTKDWEIVFTKSFASKKEAIAEEKKLKAWRNKARIEAYIVRGSME